MEGTANRRSFFLFYRKKVKKIRIVKMHKN